MATAAAAAAAEFCPTHLTREEVGGVVSVGAIAARVARRDREQSIAHFTREDDGGVEEGASAASLVRQLVRRCWNRSGSVLRRDARRTQSRRRRPLRLWPLRLDRRRRQLLRWNSCCGRWRWRCRRSVLPEEVVEPRCTAHGASSPFREAVPVLVARQALLCHPRDGAQRTHAVYVSAAQGCRRWRLQRILTDGARGLRA